MKMPPTSEERIDDLPWVLTFTREIELPFIELGLLAAWKFTGALQ
jgi:hypothetical protein